MVKEKGWSLGIIKCAGGWRIWRGAEGGAEGYYGDAGEKARFWILEWGAQRKLIRLVVAR